MTRQRIIPSGGAYAYLVLLALQVAPAHAQAPDAADADADAADEDALVSELEARVATLEAKAEEAEMAALLADDSHAELEEEPKLRFYGFADFGAQRAWTKPSTPVANFIEANALSFVTGNLNLYIDAKPADAWRTLIEVRFTNAPHGLVESPAVILGGNELQPFRRVDTYQIDPHGSGLNVPMWRGSIVIERAWTEWQAHQLLKVRVGTFFTPWGIWNIDHGSPTLISLSLPQSILQYAFPIRQTGLHLHGSTFFGDWQLGYHATLSNGRMEESLYDYDDEKAVGARLFLKRELGTFNLALGVSAYMGTQQDEVVNLYADDGLVFEQASTWEFDEKLIGVDASVDVGDLRLRGEVTSRSRRYAPGRRPESDPLFAPMGSLVLDSNSHWAYVIAAYRLPWWGLEPYFMTDGQVSMGPIGDTILTNTLGLNVHFQPGTLLKLAVNETRFGKDFNDELVTDTASLRVRTVMARLVTAF